MLQGYNLERISCEAGITVAKVSEWRDEFVANGCDQELAWLKVSGRESDNAARAAV